MAGAGVVLGVDLRVRAAVQVGGAILQSVAGMVEITITHASCLWISHRHQVVHCGTTVWIVGITAATEGVLALSVERRVCAAVKVTAIRQHVAGVVEEIITPASCPCPTQAQIVTGFHSIVNRVCQH